MKAWFLPLALLAVAPAASAASFDCAKAAGAIEKAICGDKALSAADSKLAATYTADLNKVSEQSRILLRDGQRQWIAYSRTLCDKPDRDNGIGTCLANLYANRQEELEKAVVVADGLTFVRVNIFKTRKVPPPEAKDDYGYRPYATLEVAYPQIEGAKLPSELGFNKLFQKQAKRDADDFTDISTDYWYGYSDVTVTARLISVETTSGFYGHGAAHPNSAAANEHWLRREGRLLKAEDVFSKGSGWERFIRDFCFRAVKHYGVVDKAEKLSDTTKDPTHWSFGKAGLTVFFGQYEVASYADGMPEVSIPWSALKSFLAKDAPVGR